LAVLRSQNQLTYWFGSTAKPKQSWLVGAITNRWNY
jgi:hypothetical protein